MTGGEEPLLARRVRNSVTSLNLQPTTRTDNHVHALALHYFAYNFIRKHMTKKTTPAVSAGLAAAPLTVLDLVKMIESEESKLKGRLTDYLPASSRGGDSK